MNRDSDDSPKEATNALDSIVADYGAPDVRVVRIGPGNGVTVEIGKRRSIAEEGHLLMELEAYLRHRTGRALELYMQPLADANKLRRDFGKRLKQWDTRRQELKGRNPDATDSR